MLPEIAQHTEKLYYFYEIALAGGIQPAARKLDVSAASLSYSLNQLEKATKTSLFIRQKKGLQLTDSGQVLLNFCRKFYRDLEDIDRYLQNSKANLQHRVKVGTFQSIAIYFWPLLMEALQDRTSISMSITTNRSKSITESLLRREIDIALTVEGIQHKNIIKHELYSDQYAFYTSQNLRKKNLDSKDLEKFPILFIPDASDENGITLRQYLDSWNLNFKDEFELDSFEVVAQFIKNGYGIGILPTKVAKTYSSPLYQKNILDLEESQFGNHRFFLSYREDLDLPQKLINIIIEAAENAVKSLK